MKKRLITSALPYVNNVPHLGNIIGSVLSADVFARYCKSAGYETLYICATDEYGTATENKAREMGKTPKEICDHYHEIHKSIYEIFRIEFDYFGRTSYPEQTEITQHVYRKNDENGFLLEQSDEQLYCGKCKLFLADRFVEGICPHCGCEGARGDQCDHCGKLLQPTELKEPKCKFCQGEPQLKETRHLYLDLPALKERLGEFVEKSNGEGHWPKNAISTTRTWLESGLQPRPITRDLSWGVPVPRDGYGEKVFYVWFDAVLGYVSSTKRAVGEDWERWWRDPGNTLLFQFMAKDNIPFHTVIFPAMQMASGETWTMLHHISSTEYLNYENAKFSKSRNTGVFGDDVVKTGIPIDLWRFYLLANRPEKSDSYFSWKLFFEEVNSNFIDNVGNLLNRVLTFVNKNYEGKWENLSMKPEHSRFLDEVSAMVRRAVEHFESVRLRDALEEVLAIGKAGNRFFQDGQPWKTVKTDSEQTLSLLAALVFLLREAGILLHPFMPDTSAEILRQLGMEGGRIVDLGDRSVLKTHSVNAPSLLFPKLDPKQAEKFQKEFGGKNKNQKDIFGEISLKTGKILSVRRHPEAENLYVEEIDVGEEKPRQIVSGLVKHYSEEELNGKGVVVVANLKPAKLRGVLSEGMLLAAEDKKRVEVIFHGEKPGLALELENFPAGEKPEQIGIDEFAEADLKAKAGEAFCGDFRILLDGKPVELRKVTEGKIR